MAIVYLISMVALIIFFIRAILIESKSQSLIKEFNRILFENSFLETNYKASKKCVKHLQNSNEAKTQRIENLIKERQNNKEVFDEMNSEIQRLKKQNSFIHEHRIKLILEINERVKSNIELRNKIMELEKPFKRNSEKVVDFYFNSPSPIMWNKFLKTLQTSK